MLQAISYSPGLPNRHAISPDLPGSSRIEFGSMCSITCPSGIFIRNETTRSGVIMPCFCIISIIGRCSAWFWAVFRLNSCSKPPVLTMAKRTTSPDFTVSALML